MKQPRLNDFDPNTVPELASPMDDMPVIERPGKSVKQEHRVFRKLAKANKKSKGPNQRATKKSSQQASKPASTLASYQASLVESIRKAVKQMGKEVSFMRLTPEEKKQLADLVYTYRRQGTKTSENEINRIAVNFLMHDYKAHGQASVLARVIEALKA